MRWDEPEALQRRRQVATAMSRQAYRLQRQLPAVLSGAKRWLGTARSAQFVWQFAAKQSEFGHLVVAGYRAGRFSPIAALVRTLFEDATLLAWCAIPNDSEQQAPRVARVLLDYYRRVRHKGYALPADAEQLLKRMTGAAARKPPSMEDRARQLDDDEGGKDDGKRFWGSHLGHVEMLNAYVHAELGGAPHFVEPMTRELLGFEALVYGHQYLSLSIVSIVRLSNQNALATRAQNAFARIHDQELEEMQRLIR